MAAAGGCGTARRRAARRFRLLPAPRSLLEQLFDGACEWWEDLLVAADDAQPRILEHRGVFVEVDRDDRLRARAADQMLARTGDSHGDVQIWRDRLAGLADLPGRRYPAGVDGRARGANRSPKNRGEVL